MQPPVPPLDIPPSVRLYLNALSQWMVHELSAIRIVAETQPDPEIRSLPEPYGFSDSIFWTDNTKGPIVLDQSDGKYYMLQTTAGVIGASGPSLVPPPH